LRTDWDEELLWCDDANSLIDNFECENVDDFTGGIELGPSSPKLWSEMIGILSEELTSKPWHLI
jgi:hypothetical protein